jgi:hypothetical protein
MCEISVYYAVYDVDLKNGLSRRHSMTGATIAAAQKRRLLEKEEQEMTGYGTQDMEGWEFKIVRSISGRFKNPDTIRKVCEEEARSGWEMLEKFDDSRMRFKRRTDKRKSDSQSGVDPYRTQVGMGEGTLAITIILAIALVIGIVLLLKP